MHTHTSISLGVCIVHRNACTCILCLQPTLGASCRGYARSGQREKDGLDDFQMPIFWVAVQEFNLNGHVMGNYIVSDRISARNAQNATIIWIYSSYMVSGFWQS